MTDPFARSIAVVDRELHEQVDRRDKATNELLHALFVIERAGLVIERLIEERLKAAGKTTAAV